MSFSKFINDYTHNYRLNYLSGVARFNYTTAKEVGEKEKKDAIKKGIDGLNLKKDSTEYKEKVNEIKKNAEKDYNSFMKKKREESFNVLKNGETYSEKEIESAFNKGWGEKELNVGAFSAFRQTATARANAKGLTQFRATDGALDTFDSFRSLFYKDKNHLSGKGIAAIATGAVGATYGIVKD